MKTLIFSSASDAEKVASYLYNCELDGNAIRYSSHDEPTLTLAVTLAGVDLAIVEGAFCSLPFPRDERECTSEDIPRIYVACLSAYNNGYLHGMYIDATQEAEDIEDDIEWMLSWSPVRDTEACEEWAIHDYENFESFSLGENENLEYVSKLAQILDNASNNEAMAAWLDYAKNIVNSPDLEELAEEFNSYYCGHWDSERDFVIKSYEVEEIYNWSEFQEKFKFWSYHINWDSVARDLFLSGYDSVKAKPYGIYVFREYHGA